MPLPLGDIPQSIISMEERDFDFFEVVFYMSKTNEEIPSFHTNYLGIPAALQAARTGWLR